MSARPGTVPSLDGLRAGSILLVLCAHFINARIFPGGLGVSIFFVLSGFLITRLLFVEHNATGRISLALFYTRRILRLYPVIITFAAVVLGLSVALGRPYNLIEPASALGYFSNYIYSYYQMHGISTEMPFAVFWSLSIEEHFYILLPVTFLLLRGNVVHLMRVLIAVCLSCLALRIVAVWLNPDYLNFSSPPTYMESQYRLDAIGFGVILALACESATGRRLLLGLAQPLSLATAAAVIFACLTVRSPWFRETVRYTLMGCAIDVVLAAVLFGRQYTRAHWLLNTAPLRWIGRLSYSLYVWHEGVSFFVPLHGYPHWQQAAFYLTASFAIATLSYYVVEGPFLALQRHFRSERMARPFVPATV